MTPKEQIEAAGFDSVSEVARLINKNRHTLYDWAASNPKLLRAVIRGCEQIRKEENRGLVLNVDISQQCRSHQRRGHSKKTPQGYRYASSSRWLRCRGI